MAAGLPDLVDCARMADESARLERVYELSQLPRLKDLLASPAGEVTARFDFALLPSGHYGAAVAVEATPSLVCQRCMQGFALPVDSGSEVEFTDREAPESDSERELFSMRNGMVSLRDLAEEELLLALPIVPACDTPRTCGRAPGYTTGASDAEVNEMRRPFSALQDLLKKT